MERGKFLAELQARVDAWRRERILSHEHGHKPEPLDPRLVDIIPTDQEIVLFEHAPTHEPRPPLPNPHTAGTEIQMLQRRQMRRIPRDGKR